MKKISITVIENGETKTVTALLDERTAELLEQANDEELTRLYGYEEYKARLAERKETRRHQSLDASLDGGWDIADEHCYEDDVFKNMDMKKLHNALNSLTPEQRELVYKVFFKGFSQKEVAAEWGWIKLLLGID